MFSDVSDSRIESSYYTVVYDAFLWLFGDDFVPRDVESSSARQRMGAWAIDIIVDKLESAASPSTNTDSSFFKHYLVNEDCAKKTECFVSTFMSFIAASLQKNYDQTIMSSLMKLFGPSGIGNAFEITAHSKLLASNKINHWCVGVDGILVELPLGNRSKVLVRTIEDLTALDKGQYGFPTICNFPLVDAVLPPDIALNMTIGKTHRGAASKLNNITDALGINSNQLKMVFVVPYNSISEFTFPNDLGNVQLFLTTADEISKGTLMALRPITKKRKVSSVLK